MERPTERLAASSITHRTITRLQGTEASELIDMISVEEPLEIRVVGTRAGEPFLKSLSITMRTPGRDLELAAGFLHGEGILTDRSQIARLLNCGPATGELQVQNVVKVELQPGVELDDKRLERHFYTTSSCGVCGKSSLEALSVANCTPLPDTPPIEAALIHRLPAIARSAQAVFEQTGGLHAAALIDRSGTLLDLQEDVGRHNALDKLIGARFLQGELPLIDSILFLSGRISFELVQKALMAGIPIVAAVGAPSSLAIELAERFNMTLFGFVRDGRCNLYTGEQRLAP